MNSMLQTIISKSDQLNADDLLGRPRTITITEVEITPGQPQPVKVHYSEFPDKPYFPCKSMCRVMVSAWGDDANKYVGRRMTLYRDDKVQYGGLAVGGIRISEMSGIDSPHTIVLTMTRANRKPFTVKPLLEIAPVVAKAEVDATVDVLRVAAGQGMVALQAEWISLTPALRQAISPDGKCPSDLKAVALDAGRKRDEALVKDEGTGEQDHLISEQQPEAA